MGLVEILHIWAEFRSKEALDHVWTQFRGFFGDKYIIGKKTDEKMSGGILTYSLDCYASPESIYIDLAKSLDAIKGWFDKKETLQGHIEIYKHVKTEVVGRGT